MSIKRLLITSAAFFGLCPAATAANSACPETKKLVKELAGEINRKGEVIKKPVKRQRKWKHGGRP